MKQQEYEQKKRECWDECAAEVAVETTNLLCKAISYTTFDRAFALGKLQASCEQVKEGISQEKDAEEMLTCEKRKVLYRFRMAEACKTGNNPESEYWIGYSKAIQDLFGLEGKPYVTPVDADTVTIDKDEYDKLCKYRRYAANWYWDFTTCPECGEFNPRGCICVNCNNDKNWNK